MPIPCTICQQPLTDTETQTCTRCVSATRRDLIDIEQDYAMIALEMIHRAGAATPPDPSGVRGNNDHIPGGDLMVMLAPGSTAWHSDPVDVDSILGRLERWDRDWRITFEEPAADKPATMGRLIVYLTRRLLRAAAEHPTFGEFHDDVRDMRSWLQLALRNGPQRSPVPCFCGRRALERPMPRQDGKEVEWQCSHCHRTYTWADYVLAMREDGQAV